MANEAYLRHETGKTVYVVEVNAAGQAWNGAAFATETTTRSTFAITATEIGTTGNYQATIPGTAGMRRRFWYEQFGGSPSATDDTLIQAEGPEWWDGTTTGGANLLGINGDGTGVAAFGRAVNAIVKGTVGSASTTTSIVTSSLSPSAIESDQFKGRIVTFDKDTTTTALRGQATDITASSAGGVLTVTALTHAPVSGDTFTIQ